MTKHIDKKLDTPSWYPLIEYKNKISIDNWINQVWKRVYLRRMLSSSTEQKVQIELFESIIIRNEAPDILKELHDSKPQEILKPIQGISVFELFYYMELLKRSNWYQKQQDLNILNETVIELANGKTFSQLNDEHIKAHSKYIRAPAISFHEKSDNKNWYPHLPYTNGALMAINIGFSRQDILSETQRLMNYWLGKKPQLLSSKILNSWSANNILAIHDLTQWGKITQKNYMRIKTRFARTIWANPPLDATEKLANAIKLSKRVINGSMILPLWEYKLRVSRKKQK